MYVNKVDFQTWFQKQKWIGDDNSTSTKPQNQQSKTQNQLYPYQKIVTQFMNETTPYRGILLYHGLGVGKTMSAVSIAEENQKDVVVMLPASIEQNFVNEVMKSGHQFFRKFQNHWVKVSANDHRTKNLETKFGENVVKQSMKKYKCVWDISDTGSANFESLDEESKQSVSFQVRLMIEQKYTFLHYNGISLKNVYELQPVGNYFDNKLVIIDEVHNFISRVVGGSKAINKIYNMLMESSTVRIVALSGTPLINNAIELGFLLNLIRGYLREKHYKYNKSSNFDIEALKEKLDQCEHVDYYSIQPDIKSITIGLVPEGFVKDVLSKLFVKRKSGHSGHSGQSVEEHIQTLLTIEGVVLSQRSTLHDAYVPLLPTEEKQFEELFIDHENTTVKNPIMLSRRIQGLVSYYESYNVSDYPSTSGIQIVKLEMTPEQLSRYVAVRSEEISDERNNRKSKSGKSKDSSADNGNEKAGIVGNIYKAFSRALCNFVFPEKVDRPYPSKMHLSAKEIDNGNDDSESDIDDEPDNDNNKTKVTKAAKATRLEKKRKYEVALKLALKQLEDIALTDDLPKFSPKMATIYDSIMRSQGTSLIYSNFRSVEGVYLMSEVLKKRGFWHLRASKKTGEWVLDMPPNNQKPESMFIQFVGKKDETQLLLDIFNSNFTELPSSVKQQLQDVYGKKLTNLRGEIVKTLMITQSGAEGISLKNVRQVHLMEPYWNEIRIKQVVGRAIRAKSHIQLPMSERSVDVYMYMTTFNKESVASIKSLAADKYKTVDELIYEIAQRKSNITNALLDVMKSSAIDCHQHKNKNKLDKECFKPVKQTGQLLYKTRIADEILDNDLKHVMNKKMTKKTFVEIKGIQTKEGKDVVLEKETDMLYLKDDIHSLVGKVVRDSVSGKIIGAKWAKIKKQ